MSRATHVRAGCSLGPDSCRRRHIHHDYLAEDLTVRCCPRRLSRVTIDTPGVLRWCAMGNHIVHIACPLLLRRGHFGQVHREPRNKTYATYAKGD